MVCLHGNTAFQHASRHKTSWTGWIKDPNVASSSTTLRPVYNQIDYILSKASAKALLTDARSYGGATLLSDHKPVVACLQIAHIPLVWKQNSERSKVLYDLQQLTSDSSLQVSYPNDLESCIARIQPSTNPNKILADLLDCIKESAKTSIGMLPINRSDTSPSSKLITTTETIATTETTAPTN